MYIFSAVFDNKLLDILTYLDFKPLHCVLQEYMLNIWQ